MPIVRPSYPAAVDRRAAAPVPSLVRSETPGRRDAGAVLSLEQVPVPVALLSLDGRVVRASARLGELLGTEPAGLEGRRLAEFSHPDDATLEFPHALAVVARQAAEYAVERRLTRADGESLWVSQTVTLARDEEGQPLYFVAAFADVTRQRASEEEYRRLSVDADEARRAAQRLAAVLEEGSDGAWTWEAATDRLTCTPRCADRLGPASEALPRTLRALEALVHPDDRATVQGAIEQLLQGERAVLSVEHRLRDASGDWRWMLMRARVSTHDEAGRAAVIIGTHTDIDAHARAVRHLRLLTRLGERLQRLGAAGPGGMAAGRASLLRLLGDHFDAVACVLEPVARVPAMPAGEGPAFSAIPGVAAALAAGNPIVVSDAAHDPRTVSAFADVLAPVGGGALAAVPLFDGSRWVASLLLVVRGRRAWSAEDVALLRTVAQLFLVAGLHRATRPASAAVLAPLADRAPAAHR